MKRAILWLLLSLPVCFHSLPSLAHAQEPTWEDLKKAAEEAGQEGEFARENQLVKTAIELAEKSFEPYDPRLAAALKELVVLGSAVGNPNEEAAERDRIRRKILQIDEHNLGPDDPEVAADLVALASQYPYWDDDKAPPLYTRALKIYQQAGISEGSGLLNLYFNLAGRSLFRKEYAAAESFYRQAHVIEKKGPHGCESSALTGLASTFTAEGKDREAEQLYLDAVADAEPKGPCDHCVQMKLGTLAKFYADRGQPDRAEATLIRGVALAQGSHGSTSLYVVVALDVLADFYKQRKNPDAAFRAYQQGLAILEQHQDAGDESDTEFLAGHLCTIARYLQELQRYREAESYYKWAVACYERLDMRNSRIHIAYGWREMAGLYVQQGRHEEAEKLLMDALAYDEQYTPPVSMAALGDLELLESKIFTPQAQYAEAEWAIRRQIALRETQYGHDGVPLPELLDRLAIILEKLSRPDEAQQARARAKTILRSLGQNVGD